MALIKKYVKKNGDTAYQFSAYLGINPNTGKKARTTKRGFSTKREASIALKRIEAQVAEGSYFSDSIKKLDLTFEEIYLRWLEGYQHTVKPSTLRTTIGYFNTKILPAFGNYKIRNINTNLVQKQANSWAEYVNVKRWLTYANCVFKYALTSNALDKNPMDGVIRPKIKVNERKKVFWTKDELKIFLAYAEKYDNNQTLPLFRILAFCGLRRGEALALEWNDIDFENKTMTINKTLTRDKKGLYVGKPKTKSSNRFISVDQKTIEILKIWKEHTIIKNERIFNSSSGFYLSPSKPRVWLRSICRQSGLEPIHIHGLRHTHASLLFEAGASIKEAQARLGHSSSKITLDIYTHVTQETRDKFAEVFSEHVNF